MAGATVDGEAFQRLDVWLFHARFARSRAACAGLAAAGGVRVNQLPTDKPHARVRVGDVLTLAWPEGAGRDGVVVVRVLGFSARRGTGAQARGLYEVVGEGVGSA